MKKVAIVGGGPGGLMTAYLLEQKYKGSCQITLFEASHRTGGKIDTARFDSAPVPYEAGTAELYNYHDIGPDPLLQMIESFGLATIPMKGRAVVLDGRILRNTKDIERLCGPATLKAILDLRQRAMDALPVDSWYEGNSQRDNAHPWAGRTCEEILDEVEDPTARKYLRVAAHSDLATEPHLTNGLNGLKNFLMDVPGYISLYTIVGGISRLANGLRDRLPDVRFELSAPVVRVEKSEGDSYRLSYRRERKVQTEDFDAIFVALPHNWLGSVEWAGERLRKAMTRFIAYYDRPAHYLRVSVLFKNPFWRKAIKESWFMLDSFGGCCCYDESARYDCGDYGVLSWLLGGTSALSLSGLSDQALKNAVLDSLPDKLYNEAQAQFLEAKVHRWPASVSAQPGGFPVRNTKAAHVPEPEEHPALFTVGDYLFDSTLNGVLDSADCATDLFHAWRVRQQFLATAATQNHVAPVLNGHMVRRRMVRSYLADKAHQNGHSPKCFDAKYVRDLIRVAWKAQPPYRLLDAGSANGTTLGAFDGLGIEAWGIESDPLLHGLTPPNWQERNVLGDLHKLPFPDDHFDFVYATCLELIPEAHLEQAVRELYRVTRRGVIFAGVTSDLEPEAFTRYRLLGGREVLMTLWEWSELFVANGFKVSISDEDILERLETCEERYDGENSTWYSESESLRYCFYTKDTYEDDDDDDDDDDEDEEEEELTVSQATLPVEPPPNLIEVQA